MDEFLKTFKDNLENRPEPPIDPKVFQDFKEKLVRQEDGHKKRTAGWWWIWPFLLLVLFFANAVFFFHLKESYQNLQKVELQKDTITQIKIIYRTDTIFSTPLFSQAFVGTVDHFPTNRFNRVNPVRIGTNYPNNSPMVPISGYLERYYQKDLHHWNYLSNKLTSYLYNTEPSNPVEDLTQLPASAQDLSSAPVAKLSTLFPPAVSSEIHRMATLKMPSYFPVKMSKPAINPIRQFRPKGLKGGLTASYDQPFGPNFQDQYAYSIGVRMLVEFHAPIRLQLEASYLDLRYKSDQMGDTFGVPELPSPSIDYAFHEASIFQPAMQYTLGLQYIFRTSKKWAPFFGIGYGAIALQTAEVKYNFEKDMSVTDELILPMDVTRDRRLNGVLNLNTGLEFRVSDHFHWQLEGNYYSGGNSQILIPKLLGIKTAILYRF